MNLLIRNSWLCFLLLICGCGQNPKDTSTKDTSESLSDQPAVASDNMFILIEQVDDLDSWYLSFKNDEMKLYERLFSDLNIYHGIDNMSLVVMTGRFEIEEDARIFFSNRNKQVGLFNVTWKGNDIPESDQLFFVLQKVGDYITWLEKFEEEDEARRENSIFSLGVARDLNDRTNIVNFFAVTDVEQALGFINPHLAKVIQSAGVQGTPELYVVQRLDESQM